MLEDMGGPHRPIWSVGGSRREKDANRNSNLDAHRVADDRDLVFTICDLRPAQQLLKDLLSVW